MKYIKLIIGIVIIGSFIMGCGNDKKPVNQLTKDEAKTKRKALIDSLEKKLYSNKTNPINQGAATLCMRCYDEYASAYPDEKQSPEYLFKAGDIASSLHFSQPAIGFFKRVCDKYPTYNKAPVSLFMQAFVYDDQLKDTANARKIYKEVIVKYPNTQLAKDAQSSINNLGKSAEELIKEFEAKNAAVK